MESFNMPKASEIAAALERFAPSSTAAEWDNVGLILGEADGDAARIMVCLTVTPAVVAEAVKGNVDLIVSHHPMLFRAAKKITSATPEGRLLLQLLKAEIAVYSPHTAFDNCTDGINDILAELFGLQSVKPLRSKDATGEFKLVVFVPETEIEKVAEAMFQAGAGRIGNYERCSFRIPGTGTFFGNDSANPAIGEKGKLETVQEIRLEVIVPNSKLNAVIAAMRAAHSYEEPAFDVYPLKAKSGVGEGRIGTLAKPMALAEFAKTVKSSCKAAAVGIVGDAAKPIRTVAIACGAAGEYLKDAIREKADAFVTGEMRFHEALAAEEAGIAVVLPGHYASERPGVERLAERLQKEFSTTKVWASKAEKDPIHFEN
jgi:dinuclear metal center YbgI/SA1388 family protein